MLMMMEDKGSDSLDDYMGVPRSSSTILNRSSDTIGKDKNTFPSRIAKSESGNFNEISTKNFELLDDDFQKQFLYNTDELLASDVQLYNPLPSSEIDDIQLEIGLPPPLAPPAPLKKKEEPKKRIIKTKEEKKSFGILFEDDLNFDFDNNILKMLRFYAEQGDLQTAVVMTIVLGTRISVPLLEMRQWSMAYVEILRRLQLWEPANVIIRYSTDSAVRVMNQGSTSVHLGCAKCGKPLTKYGYYCETCKAPTNPCSICHTRVKGLYSWCQVCGHGGHSVHLKEWFQNEIQCPTGCGHTCNITFSN